MADNLTTPPNFHLHLDFIRNDPLYETNKYSCSHVSTNDYEGLSTHLNNSGQNEQLEQSPSNDKNQKEMLSSKATAYYDITENQVKGTISSLNTPGSKMDNVTTPPLYLDLINDDESYETYKHSCSQRSPDDIQGKTNDLNNSEHRNESISSEAMEEYDSITEYDYINDGVEKITTKGEERETHKPPRRPLPVIPMDRYEHLKRNDHNIGSRRNARRLRIKIALGLTVFVGAVIIAVVITTNGGEDGQESKLNAKSFLDNLRLVDEITEGRSIRGITVLGSQLFVVQDGLVNVYNTTIVTPIRDTALLISGSSRLEGIVASPQCNCLYISDGVNIVYRYNLSDHVVSNWSVGGACYGLSLTSHHNVLVTLVSPPQIKEYTPNGSLVREINLDSSIKEPQHSIQLSSGQFVVSHGFSETVQRVCIVDNGGHIIQCYGGPKGTGVGQFNIPGNLAVNRYGHVLVADYSNNRVVMLSPTLTHLGYVKVPGHTLSGPSALHLDQLSRRFYVGGFTSTQFGRVTVFAV